MAENRRWELWSEFLRKVRTFFYDQGFLEVTTPALVENGAFESSLDCLKVKWSRGQGELHTSPEIEMKWALSQAQRPIFQIGKCFRDDPRTPIHRTEFSMLEFYEPHADYRQVRTRTQALFAALAPQPLAFSSLTIAQAFQQATGIDPWVHPTAASLKAAIQQQCPIETSADDTWEDLYFKLMLEKVEPALDPARFTFVSDYPPSEAALAALSADGRHAERFECYSQGIELCNGCTELRDIEELKRRYHRESQARARRKQPPHSYPQRLEAAMKAMPPAAGVAVGLDRLFLVLHQLPLLESY